MDASLILSFHCIQESVLKATVNTNDVIPLKSILGSVHFDMCKTSCQQENCNSETLHAEPNRPESDSSVGRIALASIFAIVLALWNNFCTLSLHIKSLSCDKTYVFEASNSCQEKFQHRKTFKNRFWSALRLYFRVGRYDPPGWLVETR